MRNDEAMIGDLLKTMTVTATSPDGNIHATVFDYKRIRAGFLPSTFDRYDEPELGHQLARLGITAWIAWSRERMELYRRSLGLTAQEAEQAQSVVYDSHRKQYEAALNAIEAEGASDGRVLHIRTVGMLQWHVAIEHGALRHYGEHGFLGEIHSAFEALMRDRELKIITLKSDFFDLGIPRRWLDYLNEARAINKRNQ
jgi:hypothetical protein